MNDQDRINMAEKAAAEYAPVVSDPGMIRFARRCYADGYEAAMTAVAASSPIDGRYTPLPQDKLET
ncbi:MAG: hypothetical protein WBX00_15120 [Isosphaeraceae bacterium]